MLARTLLTLLCVGVAAYALVAYSAFPLGSAVHPDMRAAFEANRAAIMAHVFASSVALLLGPLQFLPGLRARWPALHRWSGRAYLGIGVLIGGVSGLLMAQVAYGGLVGRLGFACLALAWLLSGARAYAAIRAGDIGTHQRWMIRNFALSFAAVTLRLWLPGSVALGVAFDLAYPAIAWLCWIPNLIAAEWLIRRQSAHAAAVA
jgi:uncharacterized membrane protein